MQGRRQGRRSLGGSGSGIRLPLVLLCSDALRTKTWKKYVFGRIAMVYLGLRGAPQFQVQVKQTSENH